MKETVVYEGGSTEELGQVIGDGAQGTIYSTADGRNVIKLYNQNSSIPAGRRADMIRHLIRISPIQQNPYWAENFAWPEKLVIKPSVGYRMPRVRKMKRLSFFLIPAAFNRLDPTEQGWFYGRLAAAMKIAHAIDRLSSDGIIYPDLSFNNILLDCFAGNATLIDVDSVHIPGEIPPEILGTRDFLAPELWSQHRVIPTLQSVRFQLAKVLYYLLIGYDPLDGDKVHNPHDPDKDDMARFGAKALYIEHPTDRSNRRTGQAMFAYHLGAELEHLFRQSFVAGLHHPSERPQPHQWLPALEHAFDRVIPCESPGQNCWWHSYIAHPSTHFSCPCCHQRPKGTQTVPFLYLLPHRTGHGPDTYDDSIGPDKHYVVGWPGRALYEWHTTMGKSPSTTDRHHPVSLKPHAKFAYDNGVWYLKNKALPHLEARKTQWTPIPEGNSMPLEDGTIIRFGAGPTYYHARVVLHHL